MSIGLMKSVQAALNPVFGTFWMSGCNRVPVITPSITDFSSCATGCHTSPGERTTTFSVRGIVEESGIHAIHMKGGVDRQIMQSVDCFRCHPGSAEEYSQDWPTHKNKQTDIYVNGNPYIDSYNNVTKSGKCIQCHGDRAREWKAPPPDYNQSECTSCHEGTAQKINDVEMPHYYLERGNCYECHPKNMENDGTQSWVKSLELHGNGIKEREEDTAIICGVCHEDAVDKHIEGITDATSLEVLNNDCEECHPSEEYSPLPSGTHGDGIKDVDVSCDVCHDEEPTTGAHAAHYNSPTSEQTAIDSQDCYVCHMDYPTEDASAYADDGSIGHARVWSSKVVFEPNSWADATGFANPSYNFNTQTCYATGCHNPPRLTVGTDPNPRWTDTFGQSFTEYCSSCHGYIETHTIFDINSVNDCYDCHEPSGFHSSFNY